MLKNKNILITGASSGIGKQLAADCAENDSSVYLTARRRIELELIRESLHNSFRHRSIVTDLTSIDDIHNLIESLPCLDGLVLNAGVVDYRPISRISEKNISTIFSINYNANVLLISNLLKFKKINNSASIIIIGSISSKIGVIGTSLYASSKAALSAFARVLAAELAPRKIRVNVILPGLVNTNLFDSVNHVVSNKSSENYPLGTGYAADVSNQAIFLLSDKSRWITGTEVILDGGFLNSK